ncbi:MAG: fumarate hydratase, partial [Candidatus Bathyarchaeota archaeon]
IHTPFVYIDLIANADYIQLTAFPKGTGSSMWGKLKLFGPNKANLENVRKFVLESLLDAGPRACPPYTVGVGLGGTIDYATYLAKKATTRPINHRHPNPELAKMEIEILNSINSLGIGVMGLGGISTALAVNIDYASTHLYRTPMAFDLNCWPNRRAVAKIFVDGTVEHE